MNSLRNKPVTGGSVQLHQGLKDGAVSCVDRHSGTLVSSSGWGLVRRERLGSATESGALSQRTREYSPEADACAP